MDAELTVGVYELVFKVGEYCLFLGSLSDPPFLDRIPLQFGIADPTALSCATTGFTLVVAPIGKLT